MEAVSFRLPRSAITRLKKHTQHTKWVQSLVLMSLDLCPLCGHDYKSINRIEAMVKQQNEK